MASEPPPQLYLTTYGLDADGSLSVSLESGIVYFVTTYTGNQCLQTYFCQEIPDGDDSIAIPPPSLQESPPNLLAHQELPQIVQGCLRPSLLFPDGQTIVAGLCSVVRWTLKFLLSRDPKSPFLSLLGFRQGCLSACAESSVWTKFCEVELPQATRHLLEALKQQPMDCTIAISEELAKLEAHLSRPVKAHNVLKRKQDLVKGAVNGAGEVSELVQLVQDVSIVENGKKPSAAWTRYVLDHCYMEGIDLTISDLIVFVCIHLCWTRLHPWLDRLGQHFPRLYRWHNHLMGHSQVQRTVARLQWPTERSLPCTLAFPPVAPFTLYSKDKLEPKPKTRNVDPSPILNKLKSAGVDHTEIPGLPPRSCQEVVWENLPPPLTVSGGNLPVERLLRKQQQLAGVIDTLLQLRLQDGDVLVDFCSGGGHVGLILAHLLPQNQVVLVENKEASMAMARQRAQDAGLTNVSFYQCNLDYFCGRFDVGLCLHGCGTATDLVLERCLSQGASYVCVPCCYGAVDPTCLPYPRSQRFCCSVAAGLSAQEFEMLAHCADRTETGTAKQEEGMLCMRYVDYDRSLATTERHPEYQVYLSRLQPPSCSPKNHLLVGIAPRHFHTTPNNS